MRVIGGHLGGRKFAGPVGRGTRPSSDRVREGLASALQARDLFSNAHVLDLYSGTGALAFEALSRGASDAVLVEKDPKENANIRRNARDLGVLENTTVIRLDLHKAQDWTGQPWLHCPPFDLVFADPPYIQMAKAVEVLDDLCDARLLAETGFVVLEHSAKEAPRMQAPLRPVTDYRYGDTAISLWQREPPPGEAER